MAAVWRGNAPSSELDRYERQRRNVIIEHVEKATVENKRNLESRDANVQKALRDRMRRIAADPVEARAYVMRLSMLASLRRAEEIE